jgi:hypothetical protein
MENEETQKQSSGLPSRPLIGSTAAVRRNAERKTVISKICQWYRGTADCKRKATHKLCEKNGNYLASICAEHRSDMPEGFIVVRIK